MYQTRFNITCSRIHKEKLSPKKIRYTETTTRLQNNGCVSQQQYPLLPNVSNNISKVIFKNGWKSKTIKKFALQGLIQAQILSCPKKLFNRKFYSNAIQKRPNHCYNNFAVLYRGETSRKFLFSARAEPKVSRAEPSHEPEILNFFRAEPSPSQYLVELSRALIFSSRARAEPRANFADKIF